MSHAAAFVSGLMAGGYLIVALFFLRFWQENRDRLFAFFSAAFLTLAVQRTGLTLFFMNENVTLALYGLRAAAFMLILIAILDANRADRK